MMKKFGKGSSGIMYRRKLKMLKKKTGLSVARKDYGNDHGNLRKGGKRNSRVKC